MLKEIIRWVLDKVCGTTEEEKELRFEHELRMSDLTARKLDIEANIAIEETKAIKAKT